MAAAFSLDIRLHWDLGLYSWKEQLNLDHQYVQRWVISFSRAAIRQQQECSGAIFEHRSLCISITSFQPLNSVSWVWNSKHTTLSYLRSSCEIVFDFVLPRKYNWSSHLIPPNFKPIMRSNFLMTKGLCLVICVVFCIRFQNKCLIFSLFNIEIYKLLPVNWKSIFFIALKIAFLLFY